MDKIPEAKIEEVLPNIERPEEITGSIPVEYPSAPVQVYEEQSSKKGFLIILLIFFIGVFSAIYWFFIRSSDFYNSFFPEPVPEEVNLLWWGLWEEESVYAPLIEAYQQRNPNIKIRYEKVSKDQYRERLIARSEASTGPDIFQFHNTWLNQITRVVSAIPEDIISNSDFENTFYPIHQSDLKIDEKYYGIPLMVDGMVILYNKEILSSSGIANPPQVWVGGSNDVLSTATALTVKDASGATITSGVAIGEAENISHFAEIFTVILLQNGGSLRNLTSKEASDALEVYRKFSEDGIWNLNMPNSIAAFAEGKVAMIFAPSWQIHSLKAQNPALQIGVAALPKGLNDKEISLAHYWVEGVSKTSKNQIEAWKFLKYLSSKEQLLKMYELQSAVRTFGNAYSRQDMAELLKTNEYLSPVVSQAEKNVYVTLPVSDFTYDKGINDEVMQYLKNAINDTGKGVNYNAALQTASNGVNQVFSRYLE